MFYDQASYEVRCEWGLAGIEALRSRTDVFIIVDVLSFSTCVDIATGRGASILPYAWRDASAADFASKMGAVLADSHRTNAAEGYSLSPASLLNIPAGTRLVLPSPNGATLSLSTGDVPTLAGCLRNAGAVAAAAARLGKYISVIPAGERWPDGSIRFAIEDWVGAGALLSYLSGTRSSYAGSPEAGLAAAAFETAKPALSEYLMLCSSGRELRERGFEADVALASALDVSAVVPILRAHAYIQH